MNLDKLSFDERVNLLVKILNTFTTITVVGNDDGEKCYLEEWDENRLLFNAEEFKDIDGRERFGWVGDKKREKSQVRL